MFDISKLKSVDPDFHCEIDMKTGVRKYVEYMNAHPEKKVEDPEFDAWCDRTIELYQKLSEAFKEAEE